MKLRSFLKEKIAYMIVLVIISITCEILLLAYDISPIVRVYIAITPLLGYSIVLLVEYHKKAKYYQSLKEKLEDLDQKYVIAEVIENPDFVEGKILKEIVQETGKSMLEHVNEYKHITEDYKEYIELWIHEIKIPISVSKMIIENHKTKEMKSIDEELDKIENYTQQALFYARSNQVEKDYYIAKTNLEEIVNQVILKNKNSFLTNKINIECINLAQEVYTDSKWIIFILNQIVQNSIKYMEKSEKKLVFEGLEKKDKVILSVKDNGIGVKKGEITRVFEKGFTGENGRMIGKKSTGIGLYLCKKLCDKLGIGIEFNSEKGIGTEVKLIFPKNSFMNI